MKRLLLVLLVASLLIPYRVYSQNVSDYLILQDIANYKLEAPQKVIGGYIGGPRVFNGAGVIAPTGHFYLDHNDKTYEAYYEGGSNFPSPTVQVTQHIGTDSDKWLLHEVERGFRRGNYEENMTLKRFRNIEGNNIFYSGLGGGTYRWISNRVVINIEYTDLYRQKPEPLEIVRSYLAKFPSTIPTMTIDKAHDEQWIKDEMERRLWLCDKWFLHVQLNKVELKTALKNIYDSLKVFLNYREKYYGIKSADDKNLLFNYLSQNDGTLTKSKLNEYKIWWGVNKGKGISVQ